MVEVIKKTVENIIGERLNGHRAEERIGKIAKGKKDVVGKII